SAHQAQYGLQRRAAVAGDLAPDEVIPLDTGGALVDRGDAGVAQVLGGAGLLDEAHAAMHLDAQGSDLSAGLRAPSFDHWDHEIDEGRVALALLRIRTVRRQILGRPH